MMSESVSCNDIWKRNEKNYKVNHIRNRLLRVFSFMNMLKSRSICNAWVIEVVVVVVVVMVTIL